MNEMLIVEVFFVFFFLLGGSDRSTPARLHQHIVSAFAFGLAAEALWQGSRGLGIYKQEERGFGNRAENRSASSPKQLLFLPVDPGGPEYSTLLHRWKPHTPGRENNGVPELLVQSGLCLAVMISLTFAFRRTGDVLSCLMRGGCNPAVAHTLTFLHSL